MKKAFCLVVFLTFLSFPLLSQFYVTGQEPSSVKWKQIETPHFRLVFPQSFSGKANNYANLLEKSFTNAKKLYPDISGKLPVIVHNYSMISNGYVAWAPKRIELYPLPGQSNQPDDPSQLLIMHEVTHVGEISSLKKGGTKILSYLFGEQAIGVASSLLPEWSLEGDAVYSETLFSNSGRGRSVSFLQAEKSICIDQPDIYSYSKMLFGSYRNFTPDEYVYGYLMMNYLRTKYPDFWGKNVDFTGKYPFLIIPTNLLLKQKLHLNKNQLYHIAIDSVKSSWLKEMGTYQTVNYKSLTPTRRHGFSNYLSPYITPEGDIIAIKTSLSDPMHLVEFDTINKKEKNIVTTGYVYPAFFSSSKGKIVWSQIMPDKRWYNRDFSVIKIKDIETGQMREIAAGKRYTAPALSTDATLIAAVNTLPDLSTNLVIIDPVSGNVKKEITAPGNAYLQRPEWSSDDRFITLVTLSAEGEGVSCYDVLTDQWSCLIKPSHTDIEKAELYEGRLFFLVQDSHSDNVYVKLPDDSIYQVTFSRLGISSFSIFDGRLAFSEYSKDGFNTSVISIDSLNTNDNLLSEKSLFNFGQDTLTTNPADSVSYEIKSYRRSGHPVKIHSWAPLYYNAENVLSGNVSLSPGFTILSQNDLSTVISSVGYEHQRNIDIFHSAITFQGLYPIITIGMRYGNGYLPHVFDNIQTIRSKSYYADVTVPLLYRNDRFRQLVSVSAGINHLDDNYKSWENKLIYNNYTSLTPQVYLYNLFQVSPRDIYPRWGQVLTLHKTHILGNRSEYSDLTGFTGIFFFPGIFKNNSTMITVGYETQRPLKKYIYNNMNSFTRGYNGLVSTEMEKISADYTFPLFYPDLSARSFIYLKRIRGDLFYDRLLSKGTFDEANGTYSKLTETFSSAGAEFLADFYLLRIPYEISGGVRYGYKVEAGATFTEFVMSVNIYGSTLGKKR